MVTRILRLLMSIGVVIALATVTTAEAAGGCGGLPDAAALQTDLISASSAAFPALLGPGPVGGLFNGTRMWGAVVNRDGQLCAFTTSTPDPTQTWPGSQAIAKAKAYTANAFNLNSGAGIPVLSTALLYTFAQPGHSLFGLNNSNPFDPKFLAPPTGSGGGNSQIAGGIITFGGGVPLYVGGQIVGGLGVSGDTACADHEVAKRVRHLAGLNPPGGPLVDDITYSSPDGASAFTHPLCPNTVRNGVFIGNEAPASGY